MYTFSGKLKTFSIALMILGALGMGYGFFTAPKTTEDVKEALHQNQNSHEVSQEEEHATASTHDGDSTESHSAEEEQSHLEHLLHQGQNRPFRG